jgi:ABC-type transporter Mla MlaB component
MKMHQHDTPTMFRFVLRGELDEPSAIELEHAWRTAASVLRGKELVVDVSGLSHSDAVGMDLLCRMRDQGARLTSGLPHKSELLIHALGLPVPASSRNGRSPSAWKLKLLRFVNLS